MDDELFMRKAIALSKAAAEHGNEPFGAVLEKNGGKDYALRDQGRCVPGGGLRTGRR